jgi:hypothetical protein
MKNDMKKGFCWFLMALYFLSTPFAAKSHPLPVVPSGSWLLTPISFSISNKPTVVYLPSSCSGLINDAVSGEGELSISVQGKIQNSQLSVLVKVSYCGTALTTVGSVSYQINGSMSASETRDISSGPVDVFVKGFFKLAAKNKSPDLYIGDIGYITVYPDGTVTNHIFNPGNDPDYSHPKVYCSNPTGS